MLVCPNLNCENEDSNEFDIVSMEDSYIAGEDIADAFDVSSFEGIEDIDGKSIVLRCKKCGELTAPIFAPITSCVIAVIHTDDF